MLSLRQYFQSLRLFFKTKSLSEVNDFHKNFSKRAIINQFALRKTSPRSTDIVQSQETGVFFMSCFVPTIIFLHKFWGGEISTSGGKLRQGTNNHSAKSDNYPMAILTLLVIISQQHTHCLLAICKSRLFFFILQLNFTLILHLIIFIPLCYKIKESMFHF